MLICTTFAGGINPFQGLGALPSNQPANIMQKPARKNAKRIKDEDHSTPYQPPAIKESLTTATAPKAAAVYTDPAGLQITDDALPASRCAAPHKYNVVFDRMLPGQCVRCKTADVGKVAGALRKYIELKRKAAMVRTVMHYINPKTGTADAGFGRVWMMAAKGATA